MSNLFERMKISMMCWNEWEWLAFIALVSMLAVLLTGTIHLGA